MKRLVTGLVGMLLALSVLAGVTTANHSNGSGPDFDKVNGTGQQLLGTPFGTFPATLHVNAKRDASGVGAQGMFITSIHSGAVAGDVTLKGTVDGLTVNGNEAFVCGTVEESSTVLVPVGAKTLGRHIDNGEPGAGQTSGGSPNAPDRGAGILIGGPATPPMTVCPAIPIPTNPLLQGNFIVHDGQ